MMAEVLAVVIDDELLFIIVIIDNVLIM